MFTFACKDAGLDCDHIAEGATKEEAINNASEHAKAVHGIDPRSLPKIIQDQLLSKIKEH
jgi:predicted small metal-binding protein